MLKCANPYYIEKLQIFDTIYNDWGKIHTKEKLELMEQRFIRHGEDIITITGNARCTNADCLYIKEVGCCTGNIENCEYRQQRIDAFLGYTFDGLR